MISAPPVLDYKDVIALLETKPLDPDVWQQLAEEVGASGDTVSAKSLEVILAGVRELRRVSDLALSKGLPAPASTPLAAPLFLRLARACNDPRLLKEAGMLYLSVWHLPEMALLHFERCQRLGALEKDLRPLIEAAALAVQRMAAARSGQRPSHSGVTAAQDSPPVVVNLLQKTGILPTSRVRPNLPEPAPARAPEPVLEPLPRSGIECLRTAPSMIAEGKLARAQALLLRAGEDPRHGREIAQAWASLGRAHYEAGSYPEMEMAYQEASKSEPETMTTHFNLALAKYLNHKFDQAEALYLTADRIQPNHPKVLCNLGSLYFQTGRYAEAEDALRRALRADGDYARAWDNLASALGAQNKLDASLDACRHAIELRPDYPEAYFKMGVIYLGRNCPAEAAEAFRHATSLPHLAPFAYSFLATIHARLEQTTAATVAIRQAVQLDPKCELLWMAWNELGKAHYTMRAYRSAADAFREATLIKPDESETWFNLGLAQHLDADREHARDCYRRTVTLDPSFHLAWHNLGIVCSEMNFHEEATSAFESELELRPENARAWYDLGVSLEAAGRATEARQAFEKAEILDHPPAADAA
jgi:tetratricopeptide (TPR) repeat protein